MRWALLGEQKELLSNNYNWENTMRHANIILVGIREWVHEILHVFFFWMFLYGSYEFHTSKYWSICSVSVPPYSHMHVLVLDDINPRPGQSIMQDKQKKASNKLRKGIYIPPRRRWRSLNLYYRDDARNILNEKNKKEDDNDYYRCAICLEDFEPRQEVMVTPCSHVFHGECILPWVKSSSRCPVCRFAIPQ